MKYTVHCEECGNEDICMFGAEVSWDWETQRWKVDDVFDPLFICGECGHEGRECEERLRDE